MTTVVVSLLCSVLSAIIVFIVIAIALADFLKKIRSGVHSIGQAIPILMMNSHSLSPNELDRNAISLGEEIREIAANLDVPYGDLTRLTAKLISSYASKALDAKD